MTLAVRNLKMERKIIQNIIYKGSKENSDDLRDYE
jgi:hypothetical protein